jgi:hypothetical protein
MPQLFTKVEYSIMQVEFVVPYIILQGVRARTPLDLLFQNSALIMLRIRRRCLSNMKIQDTRMLITNIRTCLILGHMLKIGKMIFSTQLARAALVL